MTDQRSFTGGAISLLRALMKIAHYSPASTVQPVAIARETLIGAIGTWQQGALDSFDAAQPPTNTDAEPSRCKNTVARGESMEAGAATGDAPVASVSTPFHPTQGGDKGEAVTEEMVTAAMRAFELMSSVLRYREKDKWHSCDIMGMRDAIRAALAAAPQPTTAAKGIDRDELIAMLQDLASVNLPREAAERQARRMADALIAKGCFANAYASPRPCPKMGCLEVVGDTKDPSWDESRGDRMSVELAMENAQLQSEVHETRNACRQLRKFLAGALCTVCGDPLGTEEEIIQNDEEETLHKHCEAA